MSEAVCKHFLVLILVRELGELTLTTIRSVSAQSVAFPGVSEGVARDCFSATGEVKGNMGFGVIIAEVIGGVRVKSGSLGDRGVAGGAASSVDSGFDMVGSLGVALLPV